MAPSRPLAQGQSMARRTYVAVLLLLSLLFAMRVLGQAVQFWTTVPWLPSFESFQGGGLPYWVLLSAQVLILGFMARHSCQVQQGRVEPRRERGRVLLWVGGTYLAGSLGRMAIGLVPGAPRWYRVWIPGAFHVVLAGYVVTLAAYHLRLSDPTPPPHRRARRRLAAAGPATLLENKQAVPEGGLSTTSDG
jgi:hypothetical protein